MSAIEKSLMRGVLGIICANGGSAKGRVRMQKMAYLAQLLGDQDFQDADFSYHYYGPYSHEVSGALQQAVVLGLLAEDKEDFGNDNARYSYRLTPLGEKWVQEAVADNGDLRTELIRILGRAHWRTLELGATTAYLQLREGIEDRNAAFDLAIQLKPACQRYQNASMALLNDIDELKAKRCL